MRPLRDYRNYSRRARTLAWAMDRAALPVTPLLRLGAPRGAAADPPRSILIVRLDHLGDVLMTTPAIAALRRAFPAARIDLLAAAWGRAAAEGNRDVGRIVEAVAPWYDPRRGEPASAADLLGGMARLRRAPYDWAFDMRGDPRVVLLYLLPAARRRFGFAGLGLERLLTDAVPYDRRRPPLDLALDLVRRALGGAVPAKLSRRPVFEVNEAARRAIARLLDEIGLVPGARFAVLAPGSNRPNNQWGHERFAALGDGLDRSGLRVVLSGRPADAPATAAVAARLARAPLDLTGRMEFAGLAALLERAALLACNDSGACHLAVAIGCPTVAIFGPSDPALTFPYTDDHRFRSLAAPIDHPRPCFELRCDSDHGYPRVAPQEVLAACLAVAR